MSRLAGPALVLVTALGLASCSGAADRAAPVESVTPSAPAASAAPPSTGQTSEATSGPMSAVPSTTKPAGSPTPTPPPPAPPPPPAKTHAAAPTPTSSKKPPVPPPAPPPALPPTSPGALDGKVIVLDPGHNLNHSSAINKQVNAGNGVVKACDTVGTSTNGGYPEHAFTWDVANRAAAILRAEGATVILTRNSDSGVGPCITTRAQIGNDAHADAFIAIHADGGPASGHGFFVMQPPPNNPNVNPGGAPQSRVLAKTMHDVFHATTGIPYSSYIANGYYPDTTTTGSINLSHGPVITIECLDMRNAGDAAIATDPNWRQRIAAGIAAGLTSFLAG
jgi:N-acetylmuramoyl-L-alanine amidase